MRKTISASLIVAFAIVGNIAYAQGLSGSAAKGAVKCELAVGKAANGFVVKKLASLKKCVDFVFICTQLKSNDPECLTKAQKICDKEFGRIARGESKVVRDVASKCKRVNPTDLTSALGLGFGSTDVQARCAAVGVPIVASLTDVAECVRRHHECRVEELVAVQAPRADALLALVGHALHDPSCPAVPTPFPSATATTPTLTATPPVQTTATTTAIATGSSEATPTPVPESTATATVITATATAITATATVITATPTLVAATPTPEITATPNAIPTAVCGNGVVEDDEQCDGADLDDEACDDLCDDEPEPPGTLACLPSCTFDFSGCLGTGCEAF